MENRKVGAVLPNAEAYREAIRVAVDAAWEGSWGEAVDAYREALRHAPEDADALTGLGMAYAQIGKHSEASAAYRRASDLASEDPVILERVGKGLERLGRIDEACKAFLACGEQCVRQEQTPELAVACWESAARLDRSCVEARVHLLKHYQRQGRIDRATEACIELARIYGEQGRPDHGVRICEHALKLSPRDDEAARLLDTLRRERRIADKKRGEDTPAPQPAGELAARLTLPDVDTLDFHAQSEEQSPGDDGSPVESARRRALMELAESVFEDGEIVRTRSEELRREAVSAALSRAIDLQTRDRRDDAIAAYRRVLESGVDRPAVHFTLGLLYMEQLRFEEATEELGRAITDPAYALAGRFALGECFRTQDQVFEALSQFLELLKLVDRDTAEQGRADHLAEPYERAREGYLIGEDEERALQFTDTVVAFFSASGWEDRILQTRRRLDALSRHGPTVTLAEALSVPSFERILRSTARSQEYAQRGMHYTAMEECQLALESAPSYLPIHRQLANVSREMGRVEEAVRKLGVIAETYQVRGAAHEAAHTYLEALELAPMETDLRTKLIHLLVHEGETERALRQCLVLAESYENLAQMDRALEIYEEALTLVMRVEDQVEWRVRILHEIGDIAMRRVDWKKALSVYGEIRDLAPDDERARLTLMELFYRVDRPRQALVELDALLATHRERGRPSQVFTVLSELTNRWPDAIPIRARLAQAHLNAGNRDEALEHLDRLGDLQLDAGQMEQAKATVRAIMALRPSNLVEYQQLLAQIEGK